MTITILPAPRVQPACMTDPDLWHSPQSDDRALAVHICRQHCPLLAQCRTLPTVPGSVQAGILHSPLGPVARQPRPSAANCATCRAATTGHTSTWGDCGQYKAYRRHRYHHEKPCEPCMEANRRKDRERAARRRQPVADACGTLTGLTRHRDRGEPPCPTCIEGQRKAAEAARSALRRDSDGRWRAA